MGQVEHAVDLIKAVTPALSRGEGRLAHEQLHDATGFSLERLFAMTFVCQKSGFVLPTLHYLERLRKIEEQQDIGPELSARVQVLGLKIYGQIGDYGSAFTIAKKFDDQTFDMFGQIGQLGAVCRRLLVVAANVNSPSLLQLAEKGLASTKHTDINSVATELFRQISALRLANSISLTKESLGNYREKLSAVRDELFRKTTDTDFKRSYNPEKGAYSCLFLEAAMDFIVGDRKIGQRKLDLAHFLNRRNGGSEASEAYGDIVSNITNLEIKDRIIWAMRRDTLAQRAYNSPTFSILEGNASIFMTDFLDGILTDREIKIKQYLKDSSRDD